MMGANTYKNISSTVTARYNETTCMSYITNKVRSYDQRGKLYISDINSIPALILEQTVDDEIYLTYLYAYDGKLLELNCTADNVSIKAGDGAEIVDLAELNIQFLSPNLLYIKATYSSDDEDELFLYVHSEQQEEIY
jgi:hypothetical protein